jgi:glutamate synthase (NADPH/NADH) small chain
MGFSVLIEAEKCMKCKKPKCKQACPVETPVNEMMKLVMENKIYEAGEILFDNNPLSVVCSLVCPHEIQCVGNCILGKKGNPVKVNTVEHYISDFYLNFLEENAAKGKRQSEGKAKKDKVAIIGSGAAGITLAILLIKKGYDLTLFEANDKIGGMLRYGIPEFRLPRSILDKIYNKLIDMEVTIRPNTLIGQVLTIDDLFRDGYKAVFIGTGVWRPRTVNIKGESLGNVHFAIDYLKNPDSYSLGRKVCIIGAGNTAVDVARTAVRHGSRDVSIMCRDGASRVTALKHEIESAKVDGVNFEYYKSPLEFNEKGVIYINREEITGENGNIEVCDIPNSIGLFEADSIIVAVSQQARNVIVRHTTGIETHENGLVITDQFGHTTREGVFAAGDVVTGPKTVVIAVRETKKAAYGIDKYIKELNRKAEAPNTQV